MTPERLATDYLSLKYWRRRAVYPSLVILILVLLVILLFSPTRQDRDQSALIIAFFAFFFNVIRGGHLYMMRSLHLELLRDHKAAYLQKLSELPDNLGKENIGFLLARLKSEIMHVESDSD